MLKFLLYPDTIFSKIVLIFTSSLVFITFLILLLDNPFSSFNANQNVKIENVFVFDKVEFDQRTKLSKQTYRINKSFNSNNSFLPGDPVKIKEKNYNTFYGKQQTEVLAVMGDVEDDVPISALIDFNNKSLKPFYVHNNGSLLLLGTTSQGKDLLSKITHSGKGTLRLIFWALLSFIIFGVLFGIVIGYYQGQRVYLSAAVRLLMKVIESTPLMLWILLSVIFVSLYFNLKSQNIYSIIYILVGFFSSPALGQLIANRIKLLHSQDFIVALKLLGISDRRIIFAHILRHYCLSDILFQSAYICAQVIFLDFTLSVLEYGRENTWGNDLWTYFDKSEIFPMYVQLIVLFSFTAFFFHLSRYFEERGQT